MDVIPLQAIVLYLISEYLLMGAKIENFSIMPSGDTLGRVEHTKPKIPIIGDFAISTAPLIGCPAILFLVSYYLGVHFNYSPGPFDILTETKVLFERTFSFIIGLNYFNWKTYLFLYFALTLGAGAAPSKTDITGMIPSLIIIVIAIFALNYFGINIPYLNIMFSWLSVVLSIAMVPLLTITAIVAILKLIIVVK